MNNYFDMLIGGVFLTSVLTILIWLVHRNLSDAFIIAVIFEAIVAKYLISQNTKNKEAFQKRCCQSFNAILDFMLEKAQAQQFGTDLAAPSSYSDLTQEYEPLCIESNRFSMRIRFKTVNRTPLPAVACNQKKLIIQKDIEWAVQQGELYGSIIVKNVYNDVNDLWVVLEVIP